MPPAARGRWPDDRGAASRLLHRRGAERRHLRPVSAHEDRINSLWIGDRLGRVERACLRSVLAHGYRGVLWCYARPEGVPEGVELRDAAEILPENAIIRHHSGSVALFTNWFRWELQRRGLGIWADCDLYLLKPLGEVPDHLFGREAQDRIGTAILRLPPDSALLPPLLDIFREVSVPSWIPWRPRLAARWRLWRDGRTGLAQMPWGTSGPRAFTHFVRACGLDRLARPQEVFYPVHWRQAGWIRDPAIGVEEATTDASCALHLWNELIKAYKDEPAPRGSFLARLQAEGA